jgi:hypothetical protein
MMSLKTMVADRLPVTDIVTSMPVDVRQMICHILVARGTATAPVVHGRVDAVTRAGRVSMETGVTMPRALRCSNTHVSRRITTMAHETNAALCHQWERLVSLQGAIDQHRDPNLSWRGNRATGSAARWLQISLTGGMWT